MENVILGALFNDFVPKLTVETHIFGHKVRKFNIELQFSGR